MDFKNESIWLMQGDCLERMKEIPDGSVDMVLCDPPYGTTACKWDSVIDLTLMWEQLKRVIKTNGAILLTASQPFTTILASSNIEQLKTSLVWKKTKAGNFQQAKNNFLKKHEDILLFSDGVIGHKSQTKRRITYNPQGIKETSLFVKRNKYDDEHSYQRENGILKGYAQTQTGYPCSVLEFGSAHNPLHPTGKPVELMEYLINTYTDENETVLDFTFGGGSTIKAALNLNRKAIGIEMGKCEKKDPKYFGMEWTDVLIDQLGLEEK